MTEVGYVLTEYPRVSETFIVDEIRQLESMGLGLRVYSCQPADEGAAQALAASAHAQPSYLSPVAREPGTNFVLWLSQVLPQFAPGHARLAWRRPRQYLAALGSVLAMSWRYRRGAPRQGYLAEFLQAGEIAIQVLEEGEVRHLHADGCHDSATVAWLAARLTGLQFSFTAHAGDIGQASARGGDLLGRKMQAARFVVTDSAASRARLAAVNPQQAALHTVYRGLDAQRFAPRLPAPTGLPLILAVGRFVPGKGFDYLVAACAQLKAAGVPAHCAVVGPPGPHSEQIRALVEQLDVADVVTLHGPVTQELLLELYRRATLFVLPCVQIEDGDQDGVPQALVEAMATGVAVVSTQVAGVAELIEHRTHGLLVPQRDSRALARVMRGLLESQPLRQKLAGAARHRICAEFDSGHTNRELYRLFSESIGAQPPQIAPVPSEPLPEAGVLGVVQGS